MTDFHRTNVNLNASDVTWLRTKYGYGWTEKVRDIVHGYVQGMNEPPTPVKDPAISLTYAEWRKFNCE